MWIWVYLEGEGHSSVHNTVQPSTSCVVLGRLLDLPTQLGPQAQTLQLAQGIYLQDPSSCPFSVLVFPIPHSEKSPSVPTTRSPGSFLPTLCCPALPITQPDCRALTKSSQLLDNPCLHYLFLSLEPPCPQLSFHIFSPLSYCPLSSLFHCISSQQSSLHTLFPLFH